MTIFDDESEIISLFQDIPADKIFIDETLVDLVDCFNSIHDEEKWKDWINSSGKNELPPDFYNDKLKLMMDVMRIDDHAYMDSNGKIINPTLQKESKIYKQLRETFGEDCKIIINAPTDLSTEEDHNFIYYLNNFKRVVSKHNGAIENYRKNHPGYKTIFMVLDESSPYIYVKRKNRTSGLLHLWFIDYNFISVINNIKADYVIWITPYKDNMNFEHNLPYASIYKVGNDYSEYKKYNRFKMKPYEK